MFSGKRGKEKQIFRHENENGVKNDGKAQEKTEHAESP